METGDPTAIRVHYILQKYMEEIESAVHRPIQIMESESLAAFPASHLLSENESMEVLLCWKQRTIAEIEKLCACHSKHFWLHLSRLMSVMPADATGYQDYVSTLTLVLMKYGAPHIENEYVIVPPFSNLGSWIFSEEPYTEETMSISDAADFNSKSKIKGAQSTVYPNMIPGQVTREDIIRIYQIERFALRYCITLSGLRLVRRGGRLKISNGSFERISLPEDIDELVDLHNQRLGKYGSLLDYLGSIVDNGNSDMAIGKGDKRFHMVIPAWNVDRKQISFNSPTSRYNGQRTLIRYTTPTFIPLLITLEPFYRKACTFRQFIENKFGFPPEAVTSFLIGLGYFNLVKMNRNSSLLHSFCVRGYDLMAVREWGKFMQTLTKSLKAAHRKLFHKISNKQSSQYTQNIMDWLTYKHDDFESICLDERTGVKLVLTFPYGIIIDYTVVPMILQSIFHELFLEEGMPVTGMTGKSKGYDFEEEVMRYLEASLPAFLPWVCGNELKFSSGISREVDISFIWGTILFIVECKTHSYSLGARRG
jgi:hypothetical protein